MKVFSKEKYIEAQGNERYESGVSKLWVDYCDGRQVYSSDGGLHVCPYDLEGNYYIIHPSWVKEVK